MAKFEYYQNSKDKQWYWRLKDGNSETIAIDGEGFMSEQHVKKEAGSILTKIEKTES